MGRRKILMVVLVLVIVASTFGSAALAQTGGKGSSKSQRLDPFTLQTLVLDANGNGGPPRVTPGMLRRQAIRIPQRPPMRSAFRPIW